MPTFLTDISHVKQREVGQVPGDFVWRHRQVSQLAETLEPEEEPEELGEGSKKWGNLSCNIVVSNGLLKHILHIVYYKLCNM